MMEIPETEAQEKAQAVLDGVLQKVSRILNERAGQGVEEEKAMSEPPEFDPNDPDLLLRPSDSILTRRDSRCIIMDAFELGREFPDVEIDPRLVFDNPTIEQLSQAIVDLPKSQRTKSLESQSTAHPHASYDMAPFTQMTTGGDVPITTSYPYQVIDTSGARFSRVTDGMECMRIPESTARIGDDSMQSGRDNEGPSHEVQLTGFLIDIEPVSMGAFARFLNIVQPTQDQLFDWCLLPAEDARCCHIPLTLAESGWQVKPGVPPNWPMILVSWYGANAYALWAHGCDWRGYKSAEQSFLPTEAQWEYAARGAEPLQYPWGNDTATADLLNVCWDTTAYDNKGNVAAHVATPLEELPLVPVNAKLGMSPFGLRGMAGNVWQWCRDTYHSNFYLATEASLPDAWNAEEGALKSERGGSWVGPASLARSSYRRGRHPEAKGRCLGFRCTASASLLENYV
ncbi:pkn1 [Symbiodinium pilosum]|uniref:Pkn1 protein n=1 Tax=Symbiodinium pilosum TaxID=2952 RepID=A0A812XK87_SYMPI|nr:pkn1 [Symbiodinium pilosum]